MQGKYALAMFAGKASTLWPCLRPTIEEELKLDPQCRRICTFRAKRKFLDVLLHSRSSSHTAYNQKKMRQTMAFRVPEACKK
jgi:hypothetical protein